MLGLAIAKRTTVVAAESGRDSTPPTEQQPGLELDPAPSASSTPVSTVSGAATTPAPSPKATPIPKPKPKEKLISAILADYAKICGLKLELPTAAKKKLADRKVPADSFSTIDTFCATNQLIYFQTATELFVQLRTAGGREFVAVDPSFGADAIKELVEDGFLAGKAPLFSGGGTNRVRLLGAGSDHALVEGHPEFRRFVIEALGLDPKVVDGATEGNTSGIRADPYVVKEFHFRHAWVYTAKLDIGGGKTVEAGRVFERFVKMVAAATGKEYANVGASSFAAERAGEPKKDDADAKKKAQEQAAAEDAARRAAQFNLNRITLLADQTANAGADRVSRSNQQYLTRLLGADGRGGILDELVRDPEALRIFASLQRSRRESTVPQRVEKVLPVGTPDILDLDLFNAPVTAALRSVVPHSNRASGGIPIEVTTNRQTQGRAMPTGGSVTLPNAASSIQLGMIVDPSNNSIIVAEERRLMPAIERVFGALDVPPPIVEIGVAVIDIDTDSAFAWGVDLGFTGIDSPREGTRLSNRSIFNGGLFGRANETSKIPADSPFIGGTTSGPTFSPDHFTPQNTIRGTAEHTPFGIAGQVIGPSWTFHARVQALEGEGDLKVITRPTVMTVDGAKAVFFENKSIFVRDIPAPADGETLPAPTAIDADLFKVNVPFAVEITPTTGGTNGNEVFLDIRITDDAEGAGSTGPNPLVTESLIETTARVGAGESILIGGRYRQGERESNARFPVAGSLPVVGARFPRQRPPVGEAAAAVPHHTKDHRSHLAATRRTGAPQTSLNAPMNRLHIALALILILLTGRAASDIESIPADAWAGGNAEPIKFGTGIVPVAEIAKKISSTGLTLSISPHLYRRKLAVPVVALTPPEFLDELVDKSRRVRTAQPGVYHPKLALFHELGSGKALLFDVEAEGAKQRLFIPADADRANSFKEAVRYSVAVRGHPGFISSDAEGVTVLGPPAIYQFAKGFEKSLWESATRVPMVFELRYAPAVSRGKGIEKLGLPFMDKKVEKYGSLNELGVVERLRQIFHVELIDVPDAGVRRYPNDSTPGPVHKKPVIFADDKLNNVIVIDHPDRRARYEHVIGLLDRPREMVEIQAAIIDVQDNAGFDWQSHFSAEGRERPISAESYVAGFGRDPRFDAVIGTENISNTGLPPSTLVGGEIKADPTVPTDTGFPAYPGLNSATMVVGSNYRVIHSIQALQRDGVARLLQQPSVLTVDNQPARIQDVFAAYDTVQGTRQAKFYKIDAGLDMRVLPRVVDHGGTKNVQLLIDIVDGSVSPDNKIGTVATATDNRIVTQAILRDGEALLIGGHYHHTQEGKDARVPVAGSLPLAGALFKDKTHERVRSQRLYLLTPRVVAPSERAAARVGAEAGEMRRIALEEQQRAATKARAQPAAASSGDGTPAAVPKRRRIIDRIRRR